MSTADLLTLIGVTFLTGGFIKGAVGLGLPVVALAFMAAAVGVRDTMAIMLLPSILTSIWQAIAGPAFVRIVRRLATFLLLAMAGIWIGVGILTVASKSLVLGLLGAVLASYSLFSLLTPQISPPGRSEPFVSPIAGGLGGVMYGMTGTFIVPGLLYVQALGFKKDTLIQALGIIFVVISSTLAVSFTQYGLFTQKLAMLSAFAVVPTFLGMWLGQRYRHRISETLFRTQFFVALLAVGLFQLGRAVL